LRSLESLESLPQACLQESEPPLHLPRQRRGPERARWRVVAVLCPSLRVRSQEEPPAVLPAEPSLAPEWVKQKPT
jgi:hypothetical protein